jgi:hypothetical protein
MTEKFLINLSNHPSPLWSKEQKSSASYYGEIIDIPFPSIDAGSDEVYISQLADEYESKILEQAEQRDITVHLMGEQTFCFALLSRLLNRGIRCIASTTERICKDLGEGHKETVFQFKRFREYKI